MQKKHKNVSRKIYMYSFLEVKIRQPLRKSWRQINIIFVIKHHTVTANSSNQIALAWHHNVHVQ